MRKGMALAWAAGLLWLLSAGPVAAQVAVTNCVSSGDPKVMPCNGTINSDLALPPGAYSVDIITQDSAGNRSAPVTVGTFVIKPQDAVAPTVKRAILVPLGANMWQTVFDCEDDVKCDGAEVTVKPIP